MPYQVALHQLEDLSHEESPREILLDTNLNTQLDIESKNGLTTISFPFGNKFDIVNNTIIIHEKSS